MKIELNEETFRYIIVGIATTLVNFTMFIILKNFMEVNIANILSIMTSIIFAFFTNKNYVFESKNENILNMFLLFIGSRAVSMVLEIILVFIFVSVLLFNSILVKIVVNIIVIILNYVFSKKIFIK